MCFFFINSYITFYSLLEGHGAKRRLGRQTPALLHRAAAAASQSFIGTDSGVSACGQCCNLTRALPGPTQKHNPRAVPGYQGCIIRGPPGPRMTVGIKERAEAWTSELGSLPARRRPKR